MICLPNWTVFHPILYLDSSSRTTHAGFRNEDAENESVPYPEVQEKAPDSNSDGRASAVEQSEMEVVLRYKNDVCVSALSVNFTILYLAT